MFIYNWKVFNESLVKEPFIKIGANKLVFLSRTNPNFIIKTFNVNYPNIIKNDEYFQKDHPNLYAKIAKINYKKGIIIQEKLDTDKVIKEFNILSNFFLRKGYFDKPLDKYLFDYTINFMRILIKGNLPMYRYVYNLIPKLNEVIPKIGKDLELLSIFNKWVSILQIISKIPEYEYDKKYIDSSWRNFGYDKEGNLKLFDI